MAYQSKNNKKFLVSTMTAAVVASAVAPSAGFAAEPNFSDVSSDNFYFEYVTALSDANIIDGRPDGSFDLGGHVNRAEAAKMIAGIKGIDTSNAASANFADVKDGVWYTDYINALYAADLIDGVSETEFAPNAELTRAQFAKLVVDAYGLELDSDADVPFTDLKDGAWYADYVKTLYSNGLITGTTATTFSPDSPVKRADFAKLLTETDWKVGSTLEKPNDAEMSVESVTAVNPTTIEVTFEGETVVEIELETALVDGNNEVTFEYEGVEYTETVNFDAAAYAVEEATAAVVVAEDSLLEADLATAQELVTALDSSDEKVLLEARVKAIQLTINDIVDAVNTAVSNSNEVELYKALNKTPFVGVNADNITSYMTDLTAEASTDRNTIAEIQTIVDSANLAPEIAATITLVDDAVAAVTAAEADPAGDNSETPAVSLIDVAQEAIDALPETISQPVIDGAATTVTETVKADLQADLDAVKAVKPVLTASNQLELLEAIQNDAFARVNADLITSYDAALDGSEITVAAIQADIDSVNLTTAQNAVTAAEASLHADDVADAQTLVSVLPDLDPNTVKEGLQDRLNVATALIAVADADTEAELLAALQNEDLALTDINPAVIAEYKEEIDTNNADITTAGNVQANVINAGNVSALATAVADVETNFVAYDETNADDQAAALAELNRLAEVSADLDAETINSDLAEEYIVAIKADLTGGSATITGADSVKAGAIQSLITVENGDLDESQRLVAVNSATTATEMKTALDAVAVAENTTDYINLSSTGKLEVAELVLVERANETDEEFATTAAVTTEIANQIAARTTFLTNVNAATNTTGMITALDVVVFPEFQALSDVDQVTVAENVLNELERLQGLTPAAQFETITAIKQAAGL